MYVYDSKSIFSNKILISSGPDKSTVLSLNKVVPNVCIPEDKPRNF